MAPNEIFECLIEHLLTKRGHLAAVSHQIRASGHTATIVTQLSLFHSLLNV